MIFRKIVLHNYGPFLGRHVIDLSVDTQTNRPIYLFGALNGSGKTSLLHSILLVLYGKRAPVNDSGESYHNYLLNSINRHASKGDGASVELEFEFPTAKQLLRLRIVRNWRTTRKGLVETVSVFYNGKLDQGWTDGWAERIEALVPLGISTLFFFDGEKVKDLATQTQTPIEVQNAIRTLLGMELPVRLDRDLDWRACNKHMDFGFLQRP